MWRVLVLVLMAAFPVIAGASDKIDAPAEGASKSVQQPHVVAELIPETTTVKAGEPFGVILHLKMDPGWHTYWINPGDAGLATTIKWTLPPGFTAGPIQWPTPEQHNLGTLVTYGYEGDVYLITTITPPATGDLPEHFPITAKANWLVCQEACIPGKAELTVQLDAGLLNFRLPVTNTELFKEARERLPLPLPKNYWVVFAHYSANDLEITFHTDWNGRIPVPKNARFFPEQQNVLSNLDKDNFPAEDAKKPQSDGKTDIFTMRIALQQNGDKPNELSGVLVSSEPLIGEAKAVRISQIPVPPPPDTGLLKYHPDSATPASGAGPAPATSDATPSGDAGDGHRPPLQQSSGAISPDAEAVMKNSLATNSSGLSQQEISLINAPQEAAGTPEPGAGPAPATSANAERTGGSPSLQEAGVFFYLGAAFVGGLILNLMPCVLPVLSLKVFALIRHAGEHPEKAWKQGVAFTAGVVVSFWVLAGLLLALRAAGNQLGWGFQMQSPGFVAALIVLFFVIGLNLFGVFEIGGSLVGVDQKAASHAGGSVSSFLNGALATVAATPCTAPFMGSALGFAAQQSAAVSMLIFTFLALGMAAPYLLLTIFPQSLRFVPKPGAWMESLKQFMGFLLMGTVIFLVYVFAELTGYDRIPEMLGVLLLLGLAAWVYGRWGRPEKAAAVRIVSIAVCLLIVIVAVSGATILTTDVDDHAMAIAERKMVEAGWQEWSPDAVKAALDKGQPVFVDFTAAWCLSCKVNERVALGTSAVKEAFAQKHVALFRADWTRQDPLISQTLQKFGRDGVPLYLLYSPKSPDAPQVLPEVLTPGIVLEALGKI